jgi:membrane associated rhomboid family serine protease
MAALAIVGPSVYRALRERTDAFLTLYTSAALVAEAASLLFRTVVRSNSYSVGASGAISGLLAALSVLRPGEHQLISGSDVRVHPLVQILINICLDVATAVKTGRSLDVAGHAGGAGAGWLFARIFLRLVAQAPASRVLYVRLR